jgi:transposase
MLTENQFYDQLLGFWPEWRVDEVKIEANKEEIHIHLAFTTKEWVDKETGEVYKIFDLRTERTWKHLDTLQYSTYLYARIPRIKLPDGRVVSIRVPWADEEIQHTHMFEDKCISILTATHNQSQTALLTKVSQERINAIMKRSVNRGLDRRKNEEQEITEICVDEKSYGRGHKYVSILSDPAKGRVLEVERNRDTAAIEKLLKGMFSEDELKRIKAACCDMWDAYITGIKKTVQKHCLYMINFTLSST